MKPVKSFGKTMNRTAMKKVQGGAGNDVIVCTKRYCDMICMAQSGFGGQCHNGQCYCLG
ncbi:hypothetical protein [Chitinophaga nivalis]|uniref:Uncharacterized protein n=1 Tax=Chitinophaga nivalis TaxID=2991709 RepID=A0ABT3IK40_9BACT|nr:hypothetical protein [Chitinophaga nivalis]MCW3466006.1 hypothetical protein [Chitinophaga nivalis]MCW3484303.1 hypothetical protein [Chitinophaga nivalis]